MTRVAVAGGTGMVGSRLVEVLRGRGHDVRVLARSQGVDVLSGDGLDEVLRGVAVVIDVVNAPVTSKRRSVAFFQTATANLLGAERRAGVGHHVALSIVGIDRVPFGYYLGKRRQEQLIRHGEVPWTILRATQFHEFPAQLIDRSRGPVQVVPAMTLQPVAAEEVAVLLCDLALSGPSGMAEELAGPEVHELRDLVRRLLRARGSHRLMLPVRLPGEAGRAMASGALLPTAAGTLGHQTWDEWLTTAGRGVTSKPPREST
jgi:uncharacterized protein YbjT (DUF2867 family)